MVTLVGGVVLCWLHGRRVRLMRTRIAAARGPYLGGTDYSGLISGSGQGAVGDWIYWLRVDERRCNVAFMFLTVCYISIPTLWITVEAENFYSTRRYENQSGVEEDFR